MNYQEEFKKDFDTIIATFVGDAEKRMLFSEILFKWADEVAYLTGKVKGFEKALNEYARTKNN